VETSHDSGRTFLGDAGLFGILWGISGSPRGAGEMRETFAESWMGVRGFCCRGRLLAATSCQRRISGRGNFRQVIENPDVHVARTRAEELR